MTDGVWQVWTEKRRAILREHYADMPRAELVALINAAEPNLPPRTWSHCKVAANDMGLRRSRAMLVLSQFEAGNPGGHAAAARLERKAELLRVWPELRAKGWSAARIGQHIGIGERAVRIYCKEAGIPIPRLNAGIRKPKPKATAPKPPKPPAWWTRPFIAKVVPPPPRDMEAVILDWLSRHKVTQCPTVALAPTTAKLPAADAATVRAYHDERRAIADKINSDRAKRGAKRRAMG